MRKIGLLIALGVTVMTGVQCSEDETVEEAVYEKEAFFVNMDYMANGNREEMEDGTDNSKDE